jgi:hypothetical protein
MNGRADAAELRPVPVEVDCVVGRAGTCGLAVNVVAIGMAPPISGPSASPAGISALTDAAWSVDGVSPSDTPPARTSLPIAKKQANTASVDPTSASPCPAIRGFTPPIGMPRRS